MQKKREQSLQNSKNGRIEKIGAMRWHINGRFFALSDT